MAACWHVAMVYDAIMGDNVSGIIPSLPVIRK